MNTHTSMAGELNPAYKHGHTIGGFSPEYHTWSSMWQRCTNPKRESWKYYGARGITVCERWRSFNNFLADMGTRPAGTTLDREDVNGNYEPGNCRWATFDEQYANRREQRIVTSEYREAIFSMVSEHPRSLPELYTAMGLHDEVVKKEVRKLRSAGLIETVPIPGRRGKSGRGTTLLCRVPLGGKDAIRKQAKTV